LANCPEDQKKLARIKRFARDGKIAAVYLFFDELP